MSNQKPMTEIRKHLGADHVAYIVRSGHAAAIRYARGMWVANDLVTRAYYVALAAHIENGTAHA